MATQPEEIRGIGHSVRRKEDDRFIRGQGNYIDDIVLPRHAAHGDPPQPVRPREDQLGSTPPRAAAAPGVVAVVTGELMAQHNLAWMPTLSGDTQAVLATDKVRFQGQEVAAVIAEDPYAAVDALELIDVDYDPLPPVVTPQQAMEAGAPVIRDEKEGQTDNHIYHWENGDKEATDAAFAAAETVVSLDTHYPRVHPSPLETCGCVADVNMGTGQVTIYMTSQAPHAIRTVFALVTGLPEENIRIFSPDIGGGFGNKVPVYPGYVVATAASLLLGRPVKWIEDRTENLISTGFARDFHMHGEMALKKDGTMLGLRVSLLADEGAFHADAQPSKFKVGLFHIVTGSYDLPAAHVSADGAYTNKAPGGVAYRCSFRVTEASYMIERLVQNAAYELGMDPSELRLKNFIKKEQFPYESASGFTYDSGDYHGAMNLALEKIGYADLRREQEQARAEGKLYGIGLAELHRGRRGGAAQGLRHPRPEDERRRRAADPPDRQGDPEDQLADPGPGTRDDVRADRGLRARHPARGREGAARRHRQHAVRPGHVRVALDADRRRGHRDGVAPRRREGGQTRGAPAGGLRGRHRVHRADVLGEGRARTRPSRSRTSRSPRTRTSPTAWSPGSRRSSTTTRRT